MKTLVRPAAREDILRQYRYYLAEKDAATAAERFLDAVQLATEELRHHPDIGAPARMKWPHLAGLRSWPIPGFPVIRIYYIHSADGVRIVRVLHGKRDIGSLLEEDTDFED